MNNKTLKILVLIFLVLLVIVFLPSFQSRIPLPKEAPEISLTQYTKDSTNKIILNDATQEITIDKDGSTWKVASYSASTDKMDALFNNLSTATVENLVSNNPDNAADYGISSTSATRIQLQGSAAKTTILIGETGPSFTSFYAQKEGSKNIYLINGALKETVSTSISDWRNKNIISLSTDQIQKIEVTETAPFTLEKNKDSKWEVIQDTNKISSDDTQIQQLVGRLSSLTASDFYTEAEALQLQQSGNTRTVTYQDKDGKTLLTMTVVPDDAYYLVVVKDKADLYKVAGYNFDDFFKLPQQ